MPNNSDLVSPTAKMVALMRALSDIPYSRQVAQLCRADQAVREYLGEDFDYIMERAALAELRFKSLSAAIHKMDVKQVVELASGLSPRGVIFSKDPAIHYLEYDLPDVQIEKRHILPHLLEWKPRPNLQVMEVDALSDAQMFATRNLLRREPTAIVHEGLMHYLHRGLKQKLILNIKLLLSMLPQPQLWITPDIITRDRYKKFLDADPRARRVIEKINGLTATDLMSNAFEDREEAQSFIEGFGFRVQKFRQTDLARQLSIPLSSGMWERLAQEEVWVMTSQRGS